MNPEALPHSRLEDGDTCLRVQPTSVNDADATFAGPATVLRRKLTDADGDMIVEQVLFKPKFGQAR